jgi:hypothetical protein
MAILILLSILTVVLVSISVIFYIWWKKYGKKIFDMVTNLKNIQKNTMNTFDSTHFNQEMERIKKIMDKYQKK